MFRFTIRELLLFTVIVAMGICWQVDRSRTEYRRERAANRAAKLEVALRESMGWHKAYESAFDCFVAREGRPAMFTITCETVEVPPELREDAE